MSSGKKMSKKEMFSYIVLLLGAGTMYKLYFLVDSFYIQMQEYFNLSHTQIGYIYSVSGWVSQFGFLAAMFIADRFSKRKMLSFALVCNGLVGVYLSTYPPFSIMLGVFCLFALFTDMLCWPTMLKTIRLLGSKEEQGRLFGFFETGRGLIDTAVNFAALGIFVWFGSNAAGFRFSILFFSTISIIVGIMAFFAIEDDKIAEIDNTQEKNKLALDGVKKALKTKEIWLVSVNVFLIYCLYIGIKYFVPFLKDVYAVPVSLVTAYGIINAYGLKMIGGPIGGFVSDKVTHSATKFLKFMYFIVASLVGVYIILPHPSIGVYFAIGFSLLISACIFSMRSVFFAPMDEVRVPREITGAAMGLGSFIGYLPGAFLTIVYGSQLDAHPGIAGYRIIFSMMIGFVILGILVSFILQRKIKSQRPEAESERLEA